MMRIFHLPVVSAIVGATFLAFSRNMNWYIMWVNITASYAWLPLAVGSIYLIVENKHPRSGLVLGAISFALLTTASPSQALIHLIYCTAFLLASYWIIHWKQRWTLAVVRNLVMLACATLILVAPALIPAAVSMKSTIRWLGHSGSVVGHERLPFKAFLDGESPPRELSNVLFPLRKVSTAVGNSYLGIIPFFLAVFALFKRRSDWIVVPLFLLGMYALLSSTGQHLGLVHINFWLPLWNKIREPERHRYPFYLNFCYPECLWFSISLGVDPEVPKHIHGAPRSCAPGIPNCFVRGLLSCPTIRNLDSGSLPDGLLVGACFGTSSSPVFPWNERRSHQGLVGLGRDFSNDSSWL